MRASPPPPPGARPAEALHLHGHPLLAAWGKQGRDYIALLDAFDDAAAYRQQFADIGQRIDLDQRLGAFGRLLLGLFGGLRLDQRGLLAGQFGAVGGKAAKTELTDREREVMAHARRASISEHTARKIICRPESPARIHLPSMTAFRYDEAVVLREFGLL